MRVSLRTKLQRDTHLFDVVDAGEKRAVQNLTFKFGKRLLLALDTLKVSAWKDVFCVAQRDEKTGEQEEDDANLCLFPVKAAGAGRENPCWEHFGRDLAAGLEGVGDGGLFEDVRNVVLNKQTLTSQVQELQELIDLGVVEKNYGLLSRESGRLDEPETVMSHVAFLPSLRFPYLDAALLEYEKPSNMPREIILRADTLSEATLVRSTEEAYASRDTEKFCEQYDKMKTSSQPSYRLLDNFQQYSVQTTTVPDVGLNVGSAASGRSKRPDVIHIRRLCISFFISSKQKSSTLQCSRR